MTEPIKFKRLHPDAIIPTRATDGSAGFDLYCRAWQSTECWWKIGTGIAVEIPRGYVGLVRGRSSMAAKGAQFFDGTIDSDYRGEVSVLATWIEEASRGKRIAQLVVVPCLTDAIEVDELSCTARGTGGFGSTGA